MISIRELSRGAGPILRSLSKARRPAVITDRGRPVGLLFPTDPDEFEDFVLEHAPDFIRARQDAARDLAAGRVRRVSDVSRDLEDRGL
jgi:hypothetical protein